MERVLGNAPLAGLLGVLIGCTLLLPSITAIVRHATHWRGIGSCNALAFLVACGVPLYGWLIIVAVLMWVASLMWATVDKKRIRAQPENPPYSVEAAPDGASPPSR